MTKTDTIFITHHYSVFNHQIEYILSMYSSNFRRLIRRFVPFHRTKEHCSDSVSFRSLLMPIPEYAAASSKVRLLFSQIGISLLKKLSFPYFYRMVYWYTLAVFLL